MDQYFGIIQIGAISNEQVHPIAGKENITSFIPLEEKHVRFVHYPDCQQLIIWLPQPGSGYSNARLLSSRENSTVEEWPVSERLSGSIQLLWDTLTIPPGSYAIEINHREGWQHRIAIEKYEAGVLPVTREKEITAEPAFSAEPIIYRDGFGTILENEDLVLRDKLNKELYRKFFRQIEYRGTFRDGTIIYIDGDTRIEFLHEMGAGKCMFFVNIPTEEQWEAATKTPVASRKEILEFVAEKVRAEQASNCNYRIEKDTIAYYYK